MGLHVFFGCYYNLFGIMKRIGALDNLRYVVISIGGIIYFKDLKSILTNLLILVGRLEN